MSKSENQNQPQDRNFNRSQVQNGGRAFKFKPLVSFITVFSFLLLAFSGFVLYIRPEGGLARWVGWRAIGLDKSSWETVHIVFCALFFLAGVIHLILNFKAIILYLTSGIDRNRKNLAEMLAAALLVLVLLLTAIWRLPPVSWLMEGRSYFKNSPAGMVVKPPAAEFEKLPLRRALEQMGRTPERAVRELEARGLKGVRLESPLEEIARRNSLTPQELYLLIRSY